MFTAEARRKYEEIYRKHYSGRFPSGHFDMGITRSGVDTFRALRGSNMCTFEKAAESVGRCPETRRTPVGAI